MFRFLTKIGKWLDQASDMNYNSPAPKLLITTSKISEYLNWLDLEHPKNKNVPFFTLRKVYHRLEVFCDGQGVVREVHIKRKKQKGIPKIVDIREGKFTLTFRSFQELKEIIRDTREKRYNKLKEE